MNILIKCRNCSDKFRLDWNPLTLGDMTPIQKERDIFDNVDAICPFCDQVHEVVFDIKVTVEDRGERK